MQTAWVASFNNWTIEASHPDNPQGPYVYGFMYRSDAEATKAVLEECGWTVSEVEEVRRG
jgi:hypothetical protein